MSKLIVRYNTDVETIQEKCIREFDPLEFSKKYLKKIRKEHAIKVKEESCIKKTLLKHIQVDSIVDLVQDYSGSEGDKPLLDTYDDYVKELNSDMYTYSKRSCNCTRLSKCGYERKGFCQSLFARKRRQRKGYPFITDKIRNHKEKQSKLYEKIQKTKRDIKRFFFTDEDETAFVNDWIQKQINDDHKHKRPFIARTRVLNFLQFKNRFWMLNDKLMDKVGVALRKWLGSRSCSPSFRHFQRRYGMYLTPLIKTS